MVTAPSIRRSGLLLALLLGASTVWVGSVSEARATQAALASAEKKFTIDGREKLLYRPQIIYFGASQRIYGIHWNSWGGKRARGDGTFPYNNCIPSCAAGKITPYPVKVVLSRLHGCLGERAYLRVTFTYKGDKPQGPPPSTTFGQGYSC